MSSPYYQPRTSAPSVVESTRDGEVLPVVVVGGGPVGMATALGLAQRGVEVVVLEAADQVSFGSRAICISRHSLEVADRLGFGERVVDRALAWQGGRSFHRDTEVLHFVMPHDPHAVRPPMVNISQSELEQLMVDTLEEHPQVSLRWGVEVCGVDQDDDAVTLTLQTAAGERTLRTAWVVAADGGRSRVRELSGLRLRGTSYEGRYVIADIHWESGLPTERMVWFDPPSNPGSTVIMHRQPDDIWRIDYQLAPDDDVEAETTESAIRARIANHLGWLASTDQHGERPWTLEWHGFYKAHALALDDFRHGRVVFAGDAAHLVPIFGVRGLNSGMEDADTLAWTLAAVLAGDAGAELLDVYAAERHHAWQQNVDNAGKSTLIMTPGSDGFRATRDALLDLAKVRPEFAHLIDPRQSSATHAHGSPLNLPAAEGTAGLLPGDPLEDRAVTTAGGKETSLHDLRGAGFGLYAVAPAEADLLLLERLGDELRAAYSREQVTAVAVGSAEELPESDHRVVLPDDHGTAAAWEAAPGEVVVVRPDGLVLARGRAADLAGRLGGDHAVDRSDPTTLVPVRLTPEQAARERVWLSLSEALDAAAPEQRAPLLTRLALALGDAVGPDHLDRVLADVAAAH